LVGKISGDILYLDPPYNQRQYATNYHLLETITKYDNPKIYGKTGLREYQNQKSAYCSKTQVKESFRDLILKADVKYIFLSYNNEGLMSLEDIKEIMSQRGKYGFLPKIITALRLINLGNIRLKTPRNICIMLLLINQKI
jgi:adenine-specific DNA-methyltransferase